MSTAQGRGRARLGGLEFGRFVPLLENGKLRDLKGMGFDFQMEDLKLLESYLLTEMVMVSEIEHPL